MINYLLKVIILPYILKIKLLDTKGQSQKELDSKRKYIHCKHA